MRKLYTSKFYSDRNLITLRSAEVILDLLFSKIKINSIIDFGCATGIWLVECKKKGAKNCLGIDGDWVDKELLELNDKEFTVHNLNAMKYVTNSKYDLAICIEVAEHLTKEMGDFLLESLTESSDVILFSAAVKGQGGTGHINEQPQYYWAEKFALRGYVCIDLIRPEIWGDDKVNVIYKQNMLLYIRKSSKQELVFDDNIIFKEYDLNRIHPKLFLMKTYSGLSKRANIIKGLSCLAKGFGLKRT